MNTDVQSCNEYWRDLRQKISKFQEWDDASLVFGAKTSESGHHYNIFSTVPDQEILAFEKNNGFELPYEYRTYLQTFGAGGAGPDYGICDFRTQVMPNLYPEPFPYSEEIWYDEVKDDDPVWSFPGLACIGTAGCGTDYYLELNGSSPGRVWTDWNEACSNYDGTFLTFYQKWVHKVEKGLERYHLLKSFIDEPSGRLKPEGLTLADIIDALQCDFEERGREWSSSIAEGEKWIYFKNTPGRVTIDENKKVLQIDVFRSNSIT